MRKDSGAKKQIKEAENQQLIEGSTANAAATAAEVPENSTRRSHTEQDCISVEHDDSMVTSDKEAAFLKTETDAVRDESYKEEDAKEEEVAAQAEIMDTSGPTNKDDVEAGND